MQIYTRFTKAMLLFITLILVLVSTVNAHTLESVKIVDIINEDMSIEETMTIRIVNNTNSNFTFALPKGATNVFVNGRQTSNKFSVRSNCSTCEFSIKYNLDKAIDKKKSEYIYSRNLNLPKKPINLEYVVHIPTGKIIDVGNSTEPSTIPVPKAITTDGKSIVVIWREKNPEMPKIYFLKYRDHESTESYYFEFTNELTEWVVWVLIIISFIIGIFIGFYFGNRLDRIEYIVPNTLLNPDEKEVISAIKEHGENVTQKEIGKRLNWSKSKVSAIMTNLEYKKIVKR